MIDLEDDKKSKLSLEERVKRLEKIVAGLITEIHYNDLVNAKVIIEDKRFWALGESFKK